MPPPSPQDPASIRRPHPLAVLAVERLAGRPTSRVLDFAAGSGRNAAFLAAAGFDVIAIGDDAAASAQPLNGVSGPFAAALSTHGLLHGTIEGIAARVDAIAARLEPGGLLLATFGSTGDARFGAGERIDARTYAPAEGDEAGVAHAYFTRAEITAMLETGFAIETLEERGVDAIAGRWAHLERPLAGAVHWFVVAQRRAAPRKP